MNNQHCEITLTVKPNFRNNKGTGYERFLKTLNTENMFGVVVPFSFHQTVPMPSAVRDTSINEHKTHHWYNWTMANWGVKYDCYAFSGKTIELEISNDKYKSVTIDFLALLDIPLAWAESVANEYDVILTLYYKINRVHGCGECTFIGDKGMTHHEPYEYPESESDEEVNF